MQKIPFVQRIKRPDGRVALYFRKGGHRRPLTGLDGTDELRAEVDAILAQISQVERAKTPRAGTVAGMLKEYTRSADFVSLARSVQKEYQRLANEVEADAGDVLLRDVTGPWIKELRDVWALRGHRAANTRLQVLKNALMPAIEDERIKLDPFSRIKKVKPPHDRGEAHPVWEDAEVEAAIALAIERKRPGLARAIALGRWGGFRRGTICSIPLNARSTGRDEHGERGPRLYWITEKRKVLCDKREDPRLSALMAKTPNKALTIAYNADGHAWKPRQLNQALDRLMATLAKAGRARAATAEDGEVYCPLTIHGLRHSRGVELALAGASDGEIMSQLEHATDRAAKIYRRQADRRTMADAAQDRIDTRIVKLKRPGAPYQRTRR